MYNGADSCLNTELPTSQFIEEYTSNNTECVYSPFSDKQSLPFSIESTEIEEQDDKLVIYTIKINRHAYLPSPFWTSSKTDIVTIKTFSLDHQEFIPLTESKRSILFQVFRI